MWWIFIKIEPEQEVDRLSVGVTRFVIIWAWFVIKWGGVVWYIFLQNKNEEEEEMREWKRVFCCQIITWILPTDLPTGISDEHISSVILSVIMTCLSSSSSSSFFFSFLIVIPLVVANKKFPSVNTKENNEVLFCW